MPGDGEDVYVRQLFGTGDPVDAAFRYFADDSIECPSFATVACTVFDPLLAHREVIG